MVSVKLKSAQHGSQLSGIPVFHHLKWVLQIDSLWPNDATWWCWSISRLGQACYLVSPSYCLNQCWLIIHGALSFSHETNFTGSAKYMNKWDDFVNTLVKFLPHLSGDNELSSVVCYRNWPRYGLSWSGWYCNLEQQELCRPSRRAFKWMIIRKYLQVMP